MASPVITLRRRTLPTETACSHAGCCATIPAGSGHFVFVVNGEPSAVCLECMHALLTEIEAGDEGEEWKREDGE